MTKLFPYILFIIIWVAISMNAQAQALGGLEFSGYGSMVTGWQKDTGQVIDRGSCFLGAGAPGCNSLDGALAGLHGSFI